MNIWHVIGVVCVLVFCGWLVFRTTPRNKPTGPVLTGRNPMMEPTHRLAEIDAFYNALREDNIRIRIGSFEMACNRLELVVSVCESVVLVEPYADQPTECRKYPREHFLISPGWTPRKTQWKPY